MDRLRFGIFSVHHVKLNFNEIYEYETLYNKYKKKHCVINLFNLVFPRIRYF